ncbi:MAG: hypothetical protein Q9166_001171 [cf. Caloplaca sp. 2 TL-2023]
MASYHPYSTSLNNQKYAKDIANNLVLDPLIYELNQEICMLASQVRDFPSALQNYTTRLATCNNAREIICYIRASLQILVIYSLTQEKHDWLYSPNYAKLLVDVEDLKKKMTVSAVDVDVDVKIPGAFPDGESTDACGIAEEGNARNVSARAYAKRVKDMEGDVEVCCEAVLRSLEGLKNGLERDGVRYQFWEPRKEGAMERKSAFVKRVDGERDWLVGEATALVLWPYADPRMVDGDEKKVGNV